MLKMTKRRLVGLVGMIGCSVVIGVAFAPNIGSAVGLLRTGNAPSSIGANPTVQVASVTASGSPLVLWMGVRADGARCVDIRKGLAANVAPSIATDVDGGWCELPPITRQATALSANLYWSPASAGGYHIVLAGQTSSPAITSVRLSTPTGTEDVPLGNGYFLGALPDVTSSGQLPPGDYSLTARDASGGVVGSLDLNKLVAQASPSN